MSDNTFYDVTITDHARYRVRVVAGYPDEAERIAKQIICEEFTRDCPDVKVEERTLEAVVTSDPDSTGEAASYRVEATYSVDFEMTVPAANREEAERHARRLYEENAGPYEFDLREDRVTQFEAWEVRS